MKSADAPTPAHDTHTPAGEVVLLTTPPEFDPAVMRDPGAWRPTFDLERGYWVERAELLKRLDRQIAAVDTMNESLNVCMDKFKDVTADRDRLTARVAELEAGLRPFADRAERLRQTQSVVEGLGRVSPMQFVDVEDLIRAAALLKPAEGT